MRLITLLLLVVSSLSPLNLFFAPSVRAAEPPPEYAVRKVGTHLVQGDPGGQMAVLNKLKTKTLPPDYPVVVMMGSGDPQSVSSLAGAMGGFKPIIRVNITHTTPVSDMANVARVIQESFPGAPVVLGNEINNQNPNNGEWKSGSYELYGRLFDALAAALGGSNPLGVAAMDTINGDYDAGVILPKIISSIGNKGAITAVFANVYDAECGGYDAARCSPTGAGPWVISQINSLAGRNLSTSNLYITEFGTVKCDSYDCIQKFYADNDNVPAALKVGFTRPPSDSTSATWVHTVPAVCEYWVAGGLRVERPTFCGGGSGNTFVYKGIDDQPDQSAKEQMASRYTLTCGNQIRLTGGIANKSLLEKPDDETWNNYFYNNGTWTNPCPGNPADPRCVVPNIVGTVTLSDQLTTIPLFRSESQLVPDPNNPKRRQADLEGYFGAIYTESTPPPGGMTIKEQKQQLISPLVSGSEEKISSLQYRCENTVTFLRSLKQACSEFDPNIAPVNVEPVGMRPPGSLVPTPRPTTDPDARCGLDSDISGTTLTYFQVLDAIEATAGFSCTNVTTLPKNIQDGLARVEVTTHEGFKPAYLVHYINTPPAPETEDPSPDINQLEYIINWFRPGSAVDLAMSEQDRIPYRVVVRKVYVPAGFSRDRQETSNNKYDSPFMTTMRSIISFPRQEELQDRKEEAMSSARSAMGGGAYNPNPSDNKLIRCPECATNPASLEAVLASRINAEFMRGGPYKETFNSCTQEDLIGETSSEIEQSLNPPGVLDPVIPSKIRTMATVVAGKDHPPEPASIRTYLLLPEEFRNITVHEQDFVNAFVPIDQQPKFVYSITKADKLKPDQVGYKYLQLSGLEISEPSLAEKDGRAIGERVSITRATTNPSTPAAPAGSGQPPIIDMSRTEEKLRANTFADESVDPNPLVPGGILARGIWEIVCNATRPFDGTQTVKYDGLDKLLKNGIKACQGSTATAGQIPTGSNGNICSGVTTVPTNNNDQSSWDIFFSYFAISVQGTSVPPEILYGFFRMEGTPTYDAFFFNRGQTQCRANSVGAVGPMQFLVKACGGAFDTWGQMATRAGIANANPCDLKDALKVAAHYIEYLANQSSASGDARWEDAGNGYYGSDRVLGVGSGCNGLTYGQCMLRMSETYGEWQ